MTSLFRASVVVLLLAVVAVLAGSGAQAQQGASPPPDPALVILPIPDRLEDIVAQLKTRDAQVGELIAKGNFPAVYVPAFQAKDLAIALEARLNTLAPAKHDAAAPAIHEIVRLAWLLDAAGDLGNRQELLAAHQAFSASVAQLVDAYEN